MVKKFLLDTNIIIALFAGDENICKFLEKSNEIFIPVIAVGELYFGFLKSKRAKKNISVLEKFLQSNTVLYCDSMTAKFYGEIKRTLKEKGHPIPENDIWIAAIAKQYNLSLATRDNHFKFVENLNIELM
ncbi:PIN domain-containing protein [Thermodesulfovibrio sp. TK110]